MDQNELTKLLDNLTRRSEEIEKELSSIADENPLVKGDYSVKVEDVGESEEDAAQEAGELDRRQAMVEALEQERKDIIIAIEKLKSGTY